jgi:hypothetical protein
LKERSHIMNRPEYISSANINCRVNDDAARLELGHHHHATGTRKTSSTNTSTLDVNTRAIQPTSADTTIQLTPPNIIQHTSPNIIQHTSSPNTDHHTSPNTNHHTSPNTDHANPNTDQQHTTPPNTDQPMNPNTDQPTSNIEDASDDNAAYTAWYKKFIGADAKKEKNEEPPPPKIKDISSLYGSVRDASWDKSLEELIEHRKKHGNKRVSQTSRLGRWIARNRVNYRKYKESGEKKGHYARMKRLEETGLVDDIKNNNCGPSKMKHACLNEWNNMFQQLLDYKAKHGNSQVPSVYSENPKLGNWVGKYRTLYRKWVESEGKTGDTVRIKRLESIGVFDDIKDGDKLRRGMSPTCWDIMIGQLKEYIKQNGHARVPQTYKENLKLGRWVSRCRVTYRHHMRTDRKEGNLQRMKQLESLGVVDDIENGYEKRRRTPSSPLWYIRCQELIEFKKKHGHLRVSKRCKETRQLGKWVTNNRQKFRKFMKTNGKEGNPQQIAQLRSIGLFDNIIIENGVERKDLRKKWGHHHNLVKNNTVDKGTAPTAVELPPSTNDREEITVLDEEIVQTAAVSPPSTNDREKGRSIDEGIVPPTVVSSMSESFVSCSEESLSKDDLSDDDTPSQDDPREGDLTQEHLNFLGSELRGGFWA